MARRTDASRCSCSINEQYVTARVCSGFQNIIHREIFKIELRHREVNYNCTIQIVFLEIHISLAISSIVTLLKPNFKNISVAFPMILFFISQFIINYLKIQNFLQY